MTNIRVAMTPLDEMKPAEWNPRTISDFQLRALMESLTKFGAVEPVVLSMDGLILGGHQRVEAARALGWPSLPAVRVKVSPKEARLLNLALNKIPEDPGPRPKPKTPKTRLGDLYLLGEHKLLCGDASKDADVERLLGGETIDVVWTDPPYGVAYQTKLSEEEAVARHRRTDGLEVSGDDLTPEAHTRLLSAAFTAALAHQADGGAWYVCAPHGPECLRFAQVMADLGIWRSSIVWVKDVFVMGRTDYHYRHEMLFYGWKPGAAHSWYSDRSQDSVWEIARPKRSEHHPTMKPVELILRGLEHVSKKGDLVYDPFVGSGSTLVACVTTERRFVGMELDPAYCDVIVDRWERMTDQKVTRER